MKTLIKQIGNLYSPDSHASYGKIIHLKNSALLISDGKIDKIYDHPNPEIPDPHIEIIDGGGMTLIPGFVDPHTHPVFWQTREAEFQMRVQGKSYEEIATAGGGIRNSARSFRNAGKSDIKEVTRKRIQTFLAHGTTTIEAKSGYGLSLESELMALEIIDELNTEQPLEMVPTFLGAHEVPDNYRDDRQAYIQLVIEKMIPEVSHRKLAKYCDVFCETGVFSVEESRQILLAARQNGLQIRLHADELSSSGGAELAAELSAVTADHLICASEAGIHAMAEKQVIPVLLPATTFFLRKNEYARANVMRKAGCRVAIATDFNPGSSMTQNMQLVWTISALKLGMLPGELLWASTLIPAVSLNLADRVGSIEIGKQADLLLLDIPNLDYLAYHMGINHVAVTLKKGQVVFRKY